MSLQRRHVLSLVLALAAGRRRVRSAARADSALDNVMAKKSIAIAIPTDFPPYGFVGTDMAPQGLDVDMARLIAAKLGVAVELVPVTSANRIPYLQTHKADLVISTLGKNAGAREGDRLHRRLLAVLPGRVRAEDAGHQVAGRPRRQDDRRRRAARSRTWS